MLLGTTGLLEVELSQADQEAESAELVLVTWAGVELVELHAAQVDGSAELVLVT